VLETQPIADFKADFFFIYQQSVIITERHLIYSSEISATGTIPSSAVFL
jgi:hypothetical protein